MMLPPGTRVLLRIYDADGAKEIPATVVPLPHRWKKKNHGDSWSQFVGVVIDGNNSVTVKHRSRVSVTPPAPPVGNAP